MSDISLVKEWFRYARNDPDELAPEESIAKAAIEKAQEVYDFCFGKIPELQPK